MRFAAAITLLFVTIFTQPGIYVHALKKSTSSLSTLRRGADYGTDPSVLIEVKENGIVRHGIRVVKNAFTKSCDVKCIDEVVAAGDQNCKNPLVIIKHALLELNNGGIVKLLYTLLVKSFFYAKDIFTHEFHLDELLREQYSKLRLAEVFEKLEAVVSENKFATFVAKRKKQSMFELMVRPAIVSLTERVQRVCDLLPDVGFSVGVTVNIQIEGICNFGIAHMVQNFASTVIKWSRTTFSKHTKMRFLENLFFEPINKLNEHFTALIGKNILHQEQHISNAVKRMIKKNAITDSIRERLLNEFDIIDTTFAVEKTDVTQFSKVDLLTKLDRVVLKSTLLFDSDYINDLSSHYIKSKIHDWALHEIGLVTSPVTRILTGELNDRKNELKEKMESTDMVRPQHNHGRWGAKRAEEKEKLEAKKLFSLYSDNLKAFSTVEDKP